MAVGTLACACELSSAWNLVAPRQLRRFRGRWLSFAEIAFRVSAVFKLTGCSPTAGRRGGRRGLGVSEQTYHRW